MSLTPRDKETAALREVDADPEVDRLRATLAVVLRMLPTKQLDSFYENRELLVRAELKRRDEVAA